MQFPTKTNWIRQITICALLLASSFFAIGIQSVAAREISQGLDPFIVESLECRKNWCEPVPKIPCCWERCDFTACTKTEPYDSAETACSSHANAYQVCMKNYQNENRDSKPSMDTVGVPDGLLGTWEIQPGLRVRFSSHEGVLAGYVVESKNNKYPIGSMAIKVLHYQAPKSYSAKVLVWGGEAENWVSVVLVPQGEQIAVQIGNMQGRYRRVGQ